MFKIAVFEQDNSGEEKIRGITRHGKDIDAIVRYNIEASLPEIVDYPEEYIPDDFTADLVLDFLKHPDLSAYLARLCSKKNIPLIASGKKHAEGMTPFT